MSFNALRLSMQKCVLQTVNAITNVCTICDASNRSQRLLMNDHYDEIEQENITYTNWIPGLVFFFHEKRFPGSVLEIYNF